MRAVFALLLLAPGVAFGGGLAETLGASDLPSVPGFENAPIINGEPAEEADFPMAGGVLVGASLQAGGEPFKLLMCTSTLIAPDVVLLAAHCVDFEAMLELSGMGGIELHDVMYVWSRQPDLSGYAPSIGAWPEDAVFATEALPHPDFSLETLQIGLAKNYDIALMFLEEPVFDAPYAILPTLEEDASLFVGQEVDVVGWGQQTANPYGPVGEKMWGTSHIAEMANFEFKVGEEVADVRKCHGDSGGPSFAYVETSSSESMRLVGVTSHAYDYSDCNETGGVDTRVGFYLDWIHAEMEARCADGSRVWCETPGVIEPPDENGLMAWEQDSEEEEEAKGCGCSSSGGAAGGFAVLVAGLLIRRRR